MVFAAAASPAAQSTVSDLSFDQAVPIIEALRDALVPPALRTGTVLQRRRAWAEWSVSRRADLRERLLRGDEDSIVNLFWFGVSFTSQPRLTPARLATLDRAASDSLFRLRLDDLAAGVLAPGSNERLQFARAVAKARGIDVAAGRDRMRDYLSAIIDRSLAELDELQQAPDSAQSTLYRGRGLSSDTSLLVDFALDRALEDAAVRKLLRQGGVARVAVVGPGLDFTDKEGGYDFYPPQTIQPFAVIDSLMRLGLAAPSVSVAAFDVNERVNAHLRSAAARAAKGSAYTVHLPLDADKTWGPRLLEFWEQLGSHVGSQTAARGVPEGAGAVKVRSVAIRPAIVRVVHPSALNIVLQRQSLRPGARFDLVIATNILLYYDVFEQSLALANIASMLEPGGLLLSSDFVYPLPAVPMTIAGDTRVSYRGNATEDVILWYRRH